jgi:VWFA-related protein
MRRPASALVTLLAFTGALVPNALAQAPPVFRAEVESTYVDVFVSDGGRAVPGLRAANFVLEDNGVRQEVELVSADTRSLHAILVFDTSSSVAGEKLAALRSAGEAFLDGLRPLDEAALVTFSHEIAWAAGPTADKQVVRGALQRLEAKGATALFDALYAALTLGDIRGRSLVVLFTDGDDNTSLLGDSQLRIVAERSNALIHVVGLGDRSDQRALLRDIADRAGGRFWTPESPRRLRDAFAAIAASMGERYVLRYAPQGVKREGWHSLNVRLKDAKGTVQARRGYWVGGR